MTGWAARRFWETASAEPAEAGFAIALDGRPVRTPGKALLVVPSRALARAIAAEWDAQCEKIEPATMPLTRMANSAIDKVTPQRDAVVEHLAAFADTDLLCYRAESPAGLVARQAAVWDPYLDWAAQALGARLQPHTGVVHRPQAPEALARLRDHVAALEIFELTAFHDLVELAGSLILAFATIHGLRSVTHVWEASRLDESWQIEQWGADEEAQKAEKIRAESFSAAKKFYDLSRRK